MSDTPVDFIRSTEKFQAHRGGDGARTRENLTATQSGSAGDITVSQSEILNGHIGSKYYEIAAAGQPVVQAKVDGSIATLTIGGKAYEGEDATRLAAAVQKAVQGATEDKKFSVEEAGEIRAAVKNVVDAAKAAETPQR